jgi:putative peptidoglycan lipid II flippase
VAFIKDLLVARQLGAGDELDAYLVALVLPSYGVAILGHSFAMAFVPTYLRVEREDSPAAARRLAGAALLVGTLVLLAVAVLLAAIAPYALALIGSSFDPAKLALCVRLFYILLAVLVLGGWISILAAVLNAHDCFRLTALAPLATAATTVVVFATFQSRWGVYALAAGLSLGFSLECAMLAWGVARRGFISWPTRGQFDRRLPHIGRQYLSVAAGTFLMSSSGIVDQSMAASLGSGTVSVLDYGSKIVAFLLTIGAFSLSTVLLPQFSRLIAAYQWFDLRKMFRGYVNLAFVVAVPGVALLIAVSEPLIRLLFERGAFTPQVTEAVSQVQMRLALQIPFYVVTILGARVLSALDCNHVVLRIGGLGLAVNVAGNYLLMHRYGVNGIAVATSVSYLITMLVTLVAVRARIREAEGVDGGAG